MYTAIYHSDSLGWGGGRGEGEGNEGVWGYMWCMHFHLVCILLFSGVVDLGGAVA